MSHYNPSDHEVKLRCDGDHNFGEPYLDYSDVSVVLKGDTVCLRIVWKVDHKCNNDHTNDAPTVYSTCQKVETVERNSVTIPVECLANTEI